ncbi:XP_029656538.1uncharacterized protein LOC115230483 [Octopus vulgaris]|uniref:XP_029656538.1uncharacterized protein LOC115230483 n=2 Tax=Octopus TaxID=6643 RepID=A0AA36AHX7_OCTVU|nr:uncharacterized protein LOC115230483 [Octopus sinensis]CAI9716478.1 XP_029656538.1uncharacterized protein LOC115230483 [Octopus vulgaris]
MPFNKMNLGISSDVLNLWPIIRQAATPLTPYETEYLQPYLAFPRNYACYPKEKDVLGASFHDGNIPKYLYIAKFPGHQNLTTALCMITQTILSNIEEWDEHTLDRILVNGCKLHEKCLKRRQAINDAYSLEIRHLPTFMVYDNSCTFQIVYSNPTYGNIMSDCKGTEKRKTLYNALSSAFFQRIHGVILKLQGFAMSIVRHKASIFYLFDSFPKDNIGRFDRFGTAKLLKFCHLKALAKYIENEFLWALPFTLVSIRMVRINL